MSFRISKPSTLANITTINNIYAPQSLYTQIIPTETRYWVDGFLSNNVAFFNNQDTTRGTLYQINDISAITAYNFPTQSADVSNSALSVYIENNIMYAWQNNTWFTCYDISNPFSPTVISKLKGTFPSGTRLMCPPQKDDNWLYVIGNPNYTVVNISNINDMSSNVFLSSPTVEYSDYRYARMLNNYFVYFDTRSLPNQNTKLWSVNKTGYFPTFNLLLDTSENLTGFQNGTYGNSFIGIIRNCGIDKFIMGGSDPSGNNAIRTFEISNNTILPLSSFIKLQAASLAGPGNCINIIGNLLYISGNNGFLEIYNISNLYNPILVRIIPIITQSRAVHVSGNYCVLGSRGFPTNSTAAIQTIKLNNDVTSSYTIKDTNEKKYKKIN